mgnify:CR=1 FL=1
MLLTKSKINRPDHKFLSIFAKNGQSNLVLVLVLHLESKDPYYGPFTNFLPTRYQTKLFN